MDFICVVTPLQMRTFLMQNKRNVIYMLYKTRCIFFTPLPSLEKAIVPPTFFVYDLRVRIVLCSMMVFPIYICWFNMRHYYELFIYFNFFFFLLEERKCSFAS